MSLFHFFFRRQPLEQRLPLKTFILEPILTPSGLVDGGEEMPHPLIWELDSDNLPDLHNGFSSLDVSGVDDAANCNVAADNWLPTGEDIEPLEFIHQLDATELNFQNPSVEIGVQELLALPMAKPYERASAIANPTFNSGVFTVGASGEVSINFIFDGGGYQGELAIFSLDGMDQFQPGSEAFIQAAAHRALTDSVLGHTVISDAHEGSRFSGIMPGEWSNQNWGEYLGVKTFNMRPGDTFGIMLVPNGTVQEVFDNPAIGGDKYPLFSLSTNNEFPLDQIADVTGDGSTFVMEDLRVDWWTDRDYNDFIFQLKGATGSASLLDDVINPDLEWRNTTLGQEILNYAHHGQTDVDVVLQEGNDFNAAWSQTFSVPADPSVLIITFSDLNFDTTDPHSINDALEISLVDASDRPLVHTIGEGRHAFFNLTEGQPTALAPGVTFNGNSVSVDLSQLEPGTEAKLSIHLVNNDLDSGTSVRIDQVQIHPSEPGIIPVATDLPAERIPDGAINFTSLTDVSSSLTAEYGQTSFNPDTKVLYADLAVRNAGDYLVRGSLLVGIDHISDPTVLVRDADGITPDGIPYYNLTQLVESGILSPGELTANQTLEFYNPQGHQFTYDLVFLSQLNSLPQFATTPKVEAIVGKPYIYEAKATDPDGDALTYSLLAGAAGMSIEPQTGRITWNPSAGDIGTQTVTLQVEDGRGGTAQQQYILSAIIPPPNRPPIFTSIPVVDGQVNTAYTYQAIATDADSDSLSFSLVNSPAGMQVDPHTGIVSWLPEGNQLGINDVTLRVTDGNGGIADQRFQVQTQIAPGNHAPIITSEPQSNFLLNAATLFEDNFNSENGGSYNLNFTNYANWVVKRGDVDLIGQGSPFNFYPGNGLYVDLDGSALLAGLFESKNAFILAPGEYDLKFDLGNHYSQTNTVTVALGDIFRETFTFPNRTTSFTHITRRISVPEQTTAKLSFDHAGGDNAGLFLDNVQLKRLAQQYSYPIEAIDPDSDPLTYSLTTAPQGMTIDPVTGEIAWTAVVVGQHSVAVKVQDNRGGVDTQQFNLNVTPGEAKSEIRGAIWSDGDADGVKDAVETGLSGVKVYLDQNSNGALDAGEPTTETDRQGQYKFTNLTPGNYVVREVLPNNFAYTSPLPTTLLGANLLKNASFEQGPSSTVYAGSTLIPNWQITQGSVDRVTFWQASNGSASIDLNGVGTGGISQTFSTVPGQKYLVSFDLSANDTNPAGTQKPVQVKAAGQSAVFFGISTNNRSNMGYQPHSWEFTANSTSTTLEFLSTTSGYYGPVIDNISAVEVISTNDFRQVVTLASGQIAEEINFGNNRVNQQNQNHQPNFTSNPPTTVTVGELWRYKAAASDPDQDALTYELLVKPEGMTVDSETGLVVWKPTSAQSKEQQWARSTPGVYDVVLAVKDQGGGIDLQSFQVQVISANSQPTITSNPTLQAAVGRPYQYRVQAQDADADTLTFRLVAAPSGMSIDPATGILNWTSTSAQLGNQSVTLTASDGRGGQTSQSFQLSVVASAPNTAPTITSTPRSTIGLGQPYLYQVTASDPNGDPLAYTLLTAPAGMTLDATGQIFWQPTATQFGSNPVSLKVTDGRGGEAVQSFTINVVSQPSNHPPTITSTPELTATVQQQYQYNLQGSDPDGDPLLWSLDSAPAGMSIDPQRGTLRWTPQLNQIGDQEVAVRATDAAGNYIGQAFTLSVRGANLPPTITSSPLTAAAGKTYQYALQAQDSNNDPLTYTLLTAPAGMTINSQTGLIQWTPTIAQLGQQQVAIQVADAHGGQVTQPYTIVVAENSSNLAPAITSNPIFTASTGELYAYDVAATDPENQPLVYQLRSAPEGMTIDPTTGLIEWTPAANQLGTHSVDVGAVDSEGLGGGQRFTVTVTANVAPTITSVPKEQATVGQPYRYDIKATDANGDKLSYTLIQAPPGMTVDASGRISWQPTDIGNQSIVVSVKDTLGATVEQSYTLSVTADTVAPKVSLVTAQSPVNLGSTVTFAVSAVDNVKVESLKLLVNGIPVALDAQGKATVKLSQVGDISAVATATDGAGNAGTASATIQVIDPTDISAPTVNLNLPNSTITAPIQITGTVTDSNLDYYKLEVAPVAGGEFVEIFRGNHQVVNGVLGQFDPSLLSNDSYILRLTAVDGNGRSSITEETVDVAGNLKLGNFTLSFTDVEIPVSGIPINVTRTYDSLNAQTTDDFGYGWRLEFRDTDLRTSLKKPDEQQQELGVQNPFQDGTKVYITLPGGQRETFTFAPKPNRLSQFLRDPVTGEPLMFDPAFTSQKGSTNTLTVKGAQITKADGKYYGMNGVPYNPEDALFGQVYVLTTKEGIVYEIDAKTGDLLTVTDTNGNKLTYSDAGIISSTGQSVKFERDAKNRIVAVVDPMGNKVKYEYDNQGDLVGVTDRENNQTQLVYDEPERKHFLTEVIDPLGRTGAKTEYDDNGRLKQIIDVNNSAVELIYDPDNSVQKVKDVFGNQTVYEYDARGNIVQEVDALGGVTKRTYDENNNLLTIIDPDGVSTTYTYDSKGNPLTITDKNGNVTRITYNQYGEILNIISPTGLKVSSTYDKRGNLLSRTNTDGQTTTFSYDSLGRLIKQTAPDGEVSTYTYDAFGNPTNFTDSRGNQAIATYDLNGKVKTLSMVFPQENQTLQSSYTYDKQGRTTSVKDPQGNVTTTEYDAKGNIIANTDIKGDRTQYFYDDKGQQIKTILPDNTPNNPDDNPVVQTEYDAAGRVISQTSPTGLKTRYVYDQLGRLTDTILPDLTPENPNDNPTEKTEYTVADRIKAEIDIFGTRTEYAYDNLGRVSRERDFFGNSSGNDTTYTYNADGQVTSITDARNRKTLIGIDDKGRASQTTYFDGTTSKVTYDSLGRTKSETNQFGQTTSYDYDAFGKIATITNPLNQQTQFTYNSRGSLVKVTDALNHSTLYSYDQYNRQTAVINANGDRTETTYDQFGQVTATKDGNQHTTEYFYDNLGALTSVKLANLATTNYTYDNLGRLTQFEDANLNKTTYEYDAFNRQIATNLPLGQRSTTTFNNFGQVNNTKDFNGDVITYGYDLYGRLGSKSFSNPLVSPVSYTYDHITSQVKTVTDGRGVTTYGFDNYDRVNLISNPDGQTVGYTYDVLGNLKTLTTSGSTVNYAYDLLNRLSTVTSNGQLAKYGYDAVGNLVSTALGDGTTETRQYDASNRLKGIETRDALGAVLSSYAYTLDGVGDRTSLVENSGRIVNYSYDEVNQLKLESITDPTLGSRTISYDYDLVGNRLKRNDSDPSSGLTTYIYDQNNRLNSETSGTRVTQYTYDNNGSMLTNNDGTNSVVYEWMNDGENRLVGVTATNASGSSQSNYIYDADGNRVASITDGVRKNYLVDPRGYSKVLQDYDANGQVLTKYSYGLGLIKSESGSDEQFYHSDALGSTRLLTDGTGQVTDRYIYDAYGRLIANAGSADNAYQFAGEQRDNTGLDYLRARYYDSDLGRLISKDAFAGHLGSPISKNPYVYANANPVNFTDPSGYFSLGEVNAAEVINGILSGATYGAAYSGAANLIIQNAQIVDGKRTDIDGKELLESLGWGALLGAVGGGIGAVPSLRLLGFGIFAGISATSVVQGASDIGNGYVLSGAVQIALALAPFASKEAMNSHPGLKAEFSRLVDSLASYNIKLSRSESGGIKVQLPRYSNPEALKWDLAEQAGIPRYIDLENPNNVFGLSYENLMQHYQLRGFDVVPKPPRASSSGQAQIFELPDNPLIKEVQYHPGSETHRGGPYYKFTLRSGTEVRIIQDMVGFKPGTVAPNQQYFNSNGQPIEYNGNQFQVIVEETN